MSALREVMKKLREGNGVVLFPEGTRSKDGGLQPGRAGIGLIIAKTLAPVLPMRIFGAFDAFPKGSRGLRLTRITVVIGKPLYFTREEVGSGDRETYQRLSDRVMTAIAALECPPQCPLDPTALDLPSPSLHPQ